jgi:Phage integrase, N-terminal SAM-like domain/AP2 domain
MQFKELIDQWLTKQRKRVELGKLKPVSLVKYESQINKWILPTLGKFEMANVRDNEVKSFSAEFVGAGLKPPRNVMKLVTGILKWSKNPLRPHRVNDLTDHVFGKLKVLSFAGVNKHRASLWRCRCECGREKAIIGGNLLTGESTCCGKCRNRFEHAPDGITTIIWLERRNKSDLPCLIDRKDYEVVKDHRWYGYKRGRTVYARSVEGVFMHHLLVPGVKFSQVRDHIPRYGLDNRRGNLRPATDSQCMTNRTSKGSERGAYRGVRFRWNKFEASIGHDGKSIYLGRFESREDAARAYNVAALKYHGEFAILNELDDVSNVIVSGVFVNGPKRGQAVVEEKK